MTVVTLHELLSRRDESLVYHRPHLAGLTRLAHKIRHIDLAPTWRALLVSLLFVARHALVLGGCTAIVIAAVTVSATLGWVAAGAALFFLEARRR
jgi:hypothetical protein